VTETPPSEELVAVLQEGLARRATDARRTWWERYLRGAIGFRGVAMAGIREALHEWYAGARIAELPADGQRRLAWMLLREPLAEDKLAGILLLEQILLPAGAASCADSLEPIAAAFEDGAITEWSTTDWLCVRVLGRLIDREGEPCALGIAAWRRSGTLWGRRAALVAFVRPAPRGDANFPGFTSLVLEVAASLAPAPERFLQTAVGWTLRDLSTAEPERVARFLDAHRGSLSREAVRMASSRLPDADRDTLLGGRFPRRRR
jgi:3-methyladenine DNA glycosylase AlkD